MNVSYPLHTYSVAQSAPGTGRGSHPAATHARIRCERANIAISVVLQLVLHRERDIPLLCILDFG